MVNEHAKALSRLGASKGGKAAAERMTKEERQVRARQAALSRWGTEMPVATHQGKLIIAGREIACAVLEDKTRVLTQETFLRAVGRAQKARGGKGSTDMISGESLPPFIAAENLRPFISNELLERAQPIEFRTRAGNKAFGYDARLLSQVCDVYLQARYAEKLTKRQMHIAEACYLLMRGFAELGIIALVDEATGYQDERARDELQKILDLFIEKELQPWTRRFPPEFFEHMYRLQGWPFKPGVAKRTQYAGKLINKYVYEELPPGVLDELRRKNPKTEQGHRRHRHHQFLTEHTGVPELDRQITTVVTVMRLSNNKAEFDYNLKKASGKPVQERLPLVIEVPVVEPSEPARPASQSRSAS